MKWKLGMSKMLGTYFISAFLILAIAFIIFRVIVRRTYLKRGRLTFIATALESLIWGPFFCFPYIYNPPSWPAFWRRDQGQNLWLAYAATVLIVLGLVLGLASMAYLGFRRSCGQQVDKLRQTGIYGLSRNPQVVTFSLMILGVVLRWPSWYALGWVMIFAAMIHMMVLTEEEHLRDVFGDEYARYCRRVPRYIRTPAYKRAASQNSR